MRTVTDTLADRKPLDPFAADELPATVSNFCPGDRVTHADCWQGTLDSPASPAAFEPSDADWDDMAKFCEWADRNDELRRDEEADANAAETFARYGL